MTPSSARRRINTAILIGVACRLAGLAPFCTAVADTRAILLQSTTSTQNSGLYDDLLPRFEAATGVRVHVVAVGTGQALRNARNCDGDVVIVHAPDAEDAFVAAGYGLARRRLMTNDFVIVGPADDPAGVSGQPAAAAALRAIAEAGAVFASRGDDSGTHRKEQALWRAAGRDPVAASGRWYRQTGSGMGATLNIAAGLGAYALTDRATWIAFANKAGLAVLFEGDPALLNVYSVIAVNPARCATVAETETNLFVDWLLSEEGQQAIGAYRLQGVQLFTPDAR